MAWHGMEMEDLRGCGWRWLVKVDTGGGERML